MGLKGKLSIILFIVLLSFSPARADAATVGDISKQLICQCGCNMVLSECTCALPNGAKAMTALIEQNLAQGQSEEQIIQSFVVQYREQVLTSPPKRGFNLMAWSLLFAGLLLGGGVIYLALKKWVKRGRHSQTRRQAKTRRK